MATKKTPKKGGRYGVPEGKPVRERPIKTPKKNTLGKVYGF